MKSQLRSQDEKKRDPGNEVDEELPFLIEDLETSVGQGVIPLLTGTFSTPLLRPLLAVDSTVWVLFKYLHRIYIIVFAIANVANISSNGLSGWGYSTAKSEYRLIKIRVFGYHACSHIAQRISITREPLRPLRNEERGLDLSLFVPLICYC